MLKTMKALHAHGFAIHWLHPRSKRPIESKWTTGPRKSASELARTYKTGYNVGVRLGEPSAVPGGYLAVIDCDVKGDEERHLREMDEAVRRLFPGIHKTAIVASGRGNGSRHYYVVSKTPVSTKRLAQSPEKVKVRMPSVPATKHEKETLHEAEIARGFRLRPAWEISIMGTGSQVVLPPSIHPDSGKRYEWSREWGVNAPYVVKGGGAGVAPKAAEIEAPTAFPALERVDLELAGVPPGTIDRIFEGTGVEDRSAALLPAAIDLLRAGLTEAEVVGVLTREDTFLGACTFEHAKTLKRERAARWLLRYTMPKARREADPGNGFEEPPPEKLSKADAAKQAAELTTELSSGWQAKIERGPENLGAKVKATLKNMVLILENDVSPRVFVHDSFAVRDLYGVSTPWGGVEGNALTDTDTINIKVWFAERWKVEPHRNLIDEAIAFICKKNAFNPVRDYIEGLAWDGKPRINTWLKDYMGAKAPEPYLSCVSRKLLCAMIARAMEPGRKFDQLVILQGEQGLRKSTALETLVGEKLFTDAKLNPTDKDSILSMQGVWLRELGELSGMRKHDVEIMKEFISRRTDRIRVPYGKKSEDFPRQCVFVGTTNQDEYLRDETGNRRYWPVLVGECNIAAIARDRDQLFAEARVAWELGEALYLDDAEALAQSRAEQGSRMESDVLEEHVAAFIEAEEKKPEKERFSVQKFQLRDAFAAGMFEALRDDRQGQLRAGAALRRLGYTKRDARIGEGRVVKVWEKRAT